MVTFNTPPAGNPANVPVYEPRTLYMVPIDREEFWGHNTIIYHFSHSNFSVDGLVY
jgi:hypothetical protein